MVEMLYGLEINLTGWIMKQVTQQCVTLNNFYDIYNKNRIMKFTNFKISQSILETIKKLVEAKKLAQSQVTTQTTTSKG